MKSKFTLFMCTAALAATSAVIITDAFDVSVVKPFALFAFAVGVIYWFSATSLRNGEITVSLSPLDLSVLFLAATSGLSLLLSQYGKSGAREFLVLVATLMFYFLAANRFDSKRLSQFFSLLVALAVALSIYGLVGSVVIGAPYRLVTTLGNATTFATFMAMCLPFALMKALESETSLRRTLFLAASFLLLISIALSQTRSTWLACAVALPFFLRTRRDWRKLLPLAVVVATSILLVMIFWPSNPLLERITDIFAEGTTLHRRLVYWGAAWEAFTASPLFGHGYGTFEIFMPAYRDPGFWIFRAEDVSRHAHNFVLEMLSETGVIGFFALSGVLIVWFIQVGRLSRIDLRVRAIATSVGICLVDNLLNVSFFQLPINLLFWMLLGSGACLSRQSSIIQKRYSLPPWSKALRFPLPALLLIIIAWQAPYFVRLVQAERSVYAGLIKFYLKKDTVAARGRFVETLRQNPSQPYSLLHLGVIDHERSEFSSSVASIRVLQRRFTFFPQSNLYLGLSYRGLGKLDSALYYMKRETEMSNHPRTYLALSQLYRQLGDVGEEVDALKNVILFHRPLIDSTTIPYYAYALERLDSLQTSQTLDR